MKGMGKSSRALGCANFLAVFFCLIFFAGCSIKDTVSRASDEDALRARIMAYCNHRIKGEPEKNYEYEDPLYRKANTQSMYARRVSGGIVRWLDANIKSIKMRDDKAFVDLTVKMKTTLMGAMSVPPEAVEHESEVRQLWVKSDGIWYHAYKPKGLQEDEEEN